jgi:rhomboid protease GluP
MGVQSTTHESPQRPAPARRRPFGAALREAPVTAVLFGICIAVFLVASTVGDTTTGATLVQFGASGRTWVWAGEPWRLLTSMFLHIGPLHLVCNLWFGFRICALAESQIGHWRFLVLYLGSGIVGSAISVIGHDALTAGASGALFGVVGWLLVTLRLRAGSWRTFTSNPAIRQQLIWIAGWFVLGYFLHFDNFAHFGGLLFGGLYTWAIAAAEPRRRRARLAVALGVGAVLVVASLHPLPFVRYAPPPSVDSDII